MNPIKNKALTGKRLLILGANPETVPLIETAQELGVYVIVTDNNPQAFAKKFANESFNVDGMDVDGLVNLVREQNIDGVLVGVADRLIEPYQQVCDTLGLPCYATAEQCAVFTDKEKFDEACQKFDIATIPNYEYDQILNSKSWDDFPLIVKPVDGNSGKGMSICHSVDELNLGVEKARLVSKRSRFLIEKFMNCEDMFIYYTFKDGDVLVSAIADRYTSNEQGDLGRVCVGAVYPSKHAELYFKKLHAKMLSFFKSLKMSDGILMISAFVENDNIYLYDPGFRLQGEAPNIPVEELCGYDQKEMLVNFALGQNNSKEKLNTFFDYRLNNNHSATLWILIGAGEIDKIIGLEELKNKSEVFSVVQRLSKGDIVTNAMIGTEAQVVARVYFTSETKDILDKNISEFSSMVEVYDLNGNRLNLKGLSDRITSGK